MARRLGFGALALLLVHCSSDTTDEQSATCAGTAKSQCAAFCGSDVVGQEICVEGEWRCPSGYVRGSECPPGTCFGYSICCGPSGEHASKICPSSDALLSPASGSCPAGFVDCQFPDGGGSGGGGSGGAGGATLDAGGMVADCLANAYSCDFCCGKFYWDEVLEFAKTVSPCVCAAGGPCPGDCNSNGVCDPQGSACNACLLAQLSPTAPCAAAVAGCSSSKCQAYVKCLASCGTPP